jgi:hypothetical protein
MSTTDNYISNVLAAEEAAFLEREAQDEAEEQAEEILIDSVLRLPIDQAIDRINKLVSECSDDEMLETMGKLFEELARFWHDKAKAKS